MTVRSTYSASLPSSSDLLNLIVATLYIPCGATSASPSSTSDHLIVRFHRSRCRRACHLSSRLSICVSRLFVFLVAIWLLRFYKRLLTRDSDSLDFLLSQVTHID